MASREHGDALTLVDEAATELDRDRYFTLVRSAPPQLQAAMAGVIEVSRKAKNGSIGTGEAYDAYRRFCQRIELRPLTGRAFGDLVSELDIYSLIRSRVLSRGRYGRTREIVLDLPQGLTEKIYGRILLNFEIHN